MRQFELITLMIVFVFCLFVFFNAYVITGQSVQLNLHPNINFNSYIKLIMRTVLFGLSLIFVLTLAHAQSYNCSNAPSEFCGKGFCANFEFTASKCMLKVQTTCPVNQRYSNTTGCVDCTVLTSSECTTKCSDFYYGTVCASCESKYGIACSSCSASACLSCQTGFNLSTNDQSCRNAICTDVQCLSCRTASRCQLCQAGFELNLTTFVCATGTCRINYCLTCSNATACSLCSTGYKLSTDKLSCMPICSDPNCISCILPGVCAGCATGFTLNSVEQTCLKNCSSHAVSRCFACNNDDICQMCLPGYGLIGGIRCAPAGCTPDCIRCADDNSTCLVCKSGKKPSPTKTSCVDDFCIITYCAQCNTSSTCKTCADGFILSQNMQSCTPSCAVQVPNCLICPPANTSVCETCKSGFKLQNAIGGSCANSSNANSSNANSSNANCTSSTPTGTSCIGLCNITSCARCSSSRTCASCQNNLVLSRDMMTCVFSCNINRCQTCSSNSQCGACASGFLLGRNNTLCLRAVDQGSVQVTHLNGTTVVSTCQSLFANCIDCTAVKCNTCATKFIISLTGLQCIACDGLFTGCLECTNFKCLSCKFPLKLSQDQCLNCSLANCATCAANLTSCATCDTGFTSINGICQFTIVCPTGTTFRNGICACPVGLFMSGTACVGCSDANCVICTSSSCTACISGFYPSINNCVSCLSNCQMCTSATDCSKCKFSYSFISGACTKLGGGSTGTAVPGKPNAVLRCPVGCSSCELNDNVLTCVIALDGYAIFGREIVKCSTQCATCSPQDPNICASCFNRFSLVGGSCVKCTGVQASTCLQNNPAFSTSCLIGFTVVGSTPGVCAACGQNCARCFINGVGKCDPGRCINGYVYNDDLKSCTNCFNNCPVCLANDLSTCVSCGPGRFMNATNRCVACPIQCVQCTSLTSCSSCHVQYTLVKDKCGWLHDYPILGYNAIGTAFTCYQGFVRSNVVCVADGDCNTNSTCLGCVFGQFLSNKRCFTCQLAAGCKSCNSNSTANNCDLPLDGFYLDGGVCKACQTGCAYCSNLQNCLRAHAGFYIVLDSQKNPTGSCITCESPCASCMGEASFCTSCVAGYQIEGSGCFAVKKCAVRLSFVPTFFVATDTSQVKFQKLYRNMPTLRNNLCGAIPAIFRIFPCHRAMKIRKCRFGSLQVENEIDVNSASDPNAAAASIQSSILTNGIGGQKVLSSSVTSEGFQPATSGLSTNLGLILGVSIPLGLILILTIFLIIKAQNSDQHQDQVQNWQNIDQMESDPKVQGNL